LGHLEGGKQGEGEEAGEGDIVLLFFVSVLFVFLTFVVLTAAAVIK